MGLVFRKNIFKISILIVCIGLINFASCSARKDSDYYREKLEDMLISENQIKLKDVFDFEFEKAYVFKDSYIDGAMFAEKYNLELNINDVKETYHETIRRIIFTDKDNNLVFEFQYTWAVNLIPKEEGMIIFPDTIVHRITDSEKKDKYVYFEFLDIPQENYY